MTQLTSRSYIVATYPNPTNDQAKAALGAMYDSLNESTEKAEVDVASASTIDIGAAASRKVRITGTTTITSFGTTYVGPIFIRFSNILTVTHNTSTLRTTTGSNITTAAGDRMILSPVASTSGTFDGWEIVSYTKAGFSAASAGSNSDITSLIPSALTSSVVAVAGGTADVITATCTPAITTLTAGMLLYIRASLANTTTTPTFSPNGLTPHTIVKGNNLAVVAGDIAGAGHWLALQYDATLLKWLLLNPATGVVGTPSSGRLLRITRLFTPSSGTWTKPPDTSFVVIKAVGGGGGGTGASGNVHGVGGGAGGYVESDYISAASSYAYVVGAGGAASSSAVNAGSGGNTTIAGMTASGGLFGGNFNSGVGEAGTGGAASGGAINIKGSKGVSYMGGSSIFGGSGSSGGRNLSATAGVFGSGGGGASADTGVGGAGGAGYIEIWEYA